MKPTPVSSTVSDRNATSWPRLPGPPSRRYAAASATTPAGTVEASASSASSAPSPPTATSGTRRSRQAARSASKPSHARRPPSSRTTTIRTPSSSATGSATRAGLPRRRSRAGSGTDRAASRSVSAVESSSSVTRTVSRTPARGVPSSARGARRTWPCALLPHAAAPWTQGGTRGGGSGVVVPTRSHIGDPGRACATGPGCTTTVPPTTASSPGLAGDQVCGPDSVAHRRPGSHMRDRSWAHDHHPRRPDAAPGPPSRRS